MTERVADKQTIRYVAGDGTVIKLTVPWGAHSGNIPPPFIEFWRDGQAIRFAYQGDA